MPSPAAAASRAGSRGPASRHLGIEIVPRALTLRPLTLRGVAVAAGSVQFVAGRNRTWLAVFLSTLALYLVTIDRRRSTKVSR